MALQRKSLRGSLVAQWQRIRLPMPETWVRSLGWEDPRYQAPQLLSLCFGAQEPQLLKPMPPKACAPQQEEPPQWAASTPQPERRPCSLQLEKAQETAGDSAAKYKQIKLVFKKRERKSMSKVGLPPILISVTNNLSKQWFKTVFIQVWTGTRANLQVDSYRLL